MTTSMRTFACCLAALALGLLLAGCGNSAAAPTPQPSPAATAAPGGEGALDQAALLSALGAAGGEVAVKGPVQQQFLSVEGSVVALNGVDVQVFEYPDTELAAEEARRLAEVVSGNSQTPPDWGGVPHLFASGRLVVLYIGDNRDTFTRLQNVLGPSVA